jgi:hypothetical protein
MAKDEYKLRMLLLYLLEEQKGHRFSEDSLFRVPQPILPLI